jgi:hypothetical protein
MTPLRNGPVLGFLTGWLVLAALLVGSGRLAPVPPPGPQLLLVTLTLGLVLLERRAGWLRRWVAGVDLRVLVALHLTRFVGVPIFLAGRSGRFPESFATPTGLGDVAVAALAAVVLFVGLPDTPRRRGLWHAWNALGFLDLALVVANAARHALADPASMETIVRLPFGLLPTWLVPVLLATHLWIFRRLSATTTAGPA